MTDTTQLAEYSDAEFDVEEVGPSTGPAASSQRVASFMIGDPPGRRRGETDPDPVAVERAVRSKAKPRAKLFDMSDAKDAQEYADLEQRSLVSSEVKLTKIREVTDGVKYSLFICWIEFEKDEEVIREDVESDLRDRKAKLLASIEPASKAATKAPDKPDRCKGTTGKGSPCTRKQRVGDYCKTHAPKPRKSVPMDAPPPTHSSLGSTA